MRLKYFAWVRERIGLAEERIDLPEHVISGLDLVLWLQTRGEGYAYAFETPETIRVAADHEHVEASSDIRQAREIALFPPMTGG